MLMDGELIFAKGQTVSSGATVLSGVIDTRVAGDAIGDELYVHVIATGGSATSGSVVSASLRTADGVSSGATSAAVVMQTVSQTAAAVVVPGTELAKFRVPEGAKRYLDLSITISGTVSGLKVDAFVNADR